MRKEDKENIMRYCSVVKRAISFIENILSNNNDDGGLLERMFQEEMPSLPKIVDKQDSPMPEFSMTSNKMIDYQIARKKHIQELTNIDVWPIAIPEYLVGEMEEDAKLERASMVLDAMIDRSIEGKTFLDFGCGEGHMAELAVKDRGAKLSTGYDIKKHSNWKTFKQAEFTHVYNELQRGVYDIILLYDVLDHDKNPEETMRQVRNLIKKDGMVYVRCHPWCSPHAMHLHKLSPILNKAYLHLFLKYEEIFDLCGQEPIFTRIEKDPLTAYRWWFKNFDIKTEKIVDSPVSEFFHVPEFVKLIAEQQQLEPNEIENFLKLMKINFVDYRLVPK